MPDCCGMPTAAGPTDGATAGQRLLLLTGQLVETTIA